MDAIPSRCDWFSKRCKSIFTDKSKLIDSYMKQFFIRTNTMFEYEGLPETIPKQDLELIKQTFGAVTIAKKDDKIYAFYGALSGELNEYYHPTNSIVTNPWLNLSKTYVIDKDCIVIKNDLMYMGLYTINQKYAELLTECDISIRKCLMNIRIDNVVSSSDESTDESIKKFFKAVEDGAFAHITTKKFMDDTLLEIHNIASKSTNPLKDLIEIRNYIDSCWWIDMGLNANANMKREAINENEINADDKTMIPMVEQMLNENINGWEKANKMFGLNVKVRLSDVWKKMHDDVVEEKEEPKEETIEDENGGDNNEDVGNQ